MKTNARIIARAIVEICKDLPAEKHAEVLDAALFVMHTRHLSREVKMFPRVLKQALEESAKTASGSLLTATGSLDDAEKEKIVTALEEALKRSVHLSLLGDASVLGGVLLSIGDERFDATLRGALEQCRTFLQAPISTPSL
jgi:F0F1-type ATP synthase delta subunit